MKDKILYLIIGFLLCAVILLSISAVSGTNGSTGKYQLNASSENGRSAWIINTETGAAVRIVTNWGIESKKKNGSFSLEEIQEALNSK